MTSHPGGAIYGLAGTPARISHGLFHAQTSIKICVIGFVMSASVGIVGALLMGGVMSAAWALGPTGFP